MAVEVRTAGLSSNVLVEEMRMDTDAILESLPYGESAHATFIMTGPDSASASYGIEALSQAAASERLRATVYVPVEGSADIPFEDDGGFPGKHFRAVTNPQEMREMHQQGKIEGDGAYAKYKPNDEATLALLRFLNADNETDSIVPLLPGANAKLDADVRNTINKHKDVDGVAPDPNYTPTTPEGMVELADHILATLPPGHPLRERGITTVKEIPPDELAVFGFGAVVGKPLVDIVMPAHQIGIDGANIYHNRAEIETQGLPALAVGSIALAFTGYRGAGTMREVAPGTIVVDVGNAIDETTGKPMGNAHPDLVAQNGQEGRVITKFIDGGGRVTIAIVMRRTAENRVTPVYAE